PGAAFEVGPEPPARRRGGDAGDAARLDVSPRRADRGTRALPAPAARRHDRAEPMERGAAQPPAGAARGSRAAGRAVRSHHVFHKYRVRLDPERAGVGLSPIALRDRVLEALRAEGVEAVLWQTAPLPAHPLFASASASESRERHPNTVAALDSTILIGSQS